MSEPLVLLTAENERVMVDARILSMSMLIKSIVEDAEPGEELHLIKVSKANLSHIQRYCAHHNYQAPPALPRPLPSSKLGDHVDSWDVEFVNAFSDEELVELVNVCDFLDIKCILELCLAKIALFFKGKEMQDLQAEYNIEEELTDEKEDQLKLEFPWALEADEAPST
jgi:hypothetical protein